MITLSYIILLLGVFILPLFKKKPSQPKSVYKIDTDTHNAHYAVNQYGYLEAINDNKIAGESY